MKTNHRFALRSILGTTVLFGLAGVVGTALVAPGVHVDGEVIAVAFGAATVLCLGALMRVGSPRVRKPARATDAVPVSTVLRPVALRAPSSRQPVLARRREGDRLAA